MSYPAFNNMIINSPYAKKNILVFDKLILDRK